MKVTTNKKITVVAVCGPTASGKSALAEEIAVRLNGAVISCDSMQIYKGMDIGTAKPTRDDRMRVEYRMIDVVEPDRDFSCAEFTKMAAEAILQTHEKGKLPVICGGTGLYMDNLLYRTEFSPAGGDDDYRRSLEGFDNGELHKMLQAVDPRSAEAIHENNRKRVVRALEIYHLTGKTKSCWDDMSRVKTSDYNVIKIILTAENREVLYDRINRRVDIMLENGLVEEAKGIDLEKCKTARQAIAYKELEGYLKGEITLSRAAEGLKQATRNYAKRQITWFARENDGMRLDISSHTGEEIIAIGVDYVKEKIREFEMQE